MKKPISQVLPSDIITDDILTRVPPRSLMRFRCVCKNWSNLIPHDPSFATLHSRKCKKSTSSSGFIGIADGDVVFIDHIDKRKTILSRVGDRNWIEHSFDGLLVLRCPSKDYESYSYCVYNPITFHAFDIPTPINDGKICEFRLCYDSVVEKHKVVFCGPYKKDLPLQKIKVLTVGKGSLGEEGGGRNDVQWRDIVVPSTFELHYDSLDYHSCFSLNDAVYWIARPNIINPRHDIFKLYILVLNISREVLYRIKLPKFGSVTRGAYLNEMEGALCLSYHTSNTVLKTWTLKRKNEGCDDDDGDQQWVERFHIDFRQSMENLHGFINLEKVCSILEPFAFLKDPKPKLMLARINDEDKYFFPQWTYYSYDMESKQLEIIYGPARPGAGIPLCWHVPSISYC